VEKSTPAAAAVVLRTRRADGGAGIATAEAGRRSPANMRHRIAFARHGRMWPALGMRPDGRVPCGGVDATALVLVSR